MVIHNSRNPLSATPTTWSVTFKQIVGCCRLKSLINLTGRKEKGDNHLNLSCE